MVKIRIRAFRAIDDIDACNLYAQSHLDILKIFGITKITTANNSWIHNPNVYVIMAESADGSQALGGARIHLYHPEYPLPFEDAVREFDPDINKLVEQHVRGGGTGEICGLWNAREVAGWGIGTILLSRAGVALSKQLPMHSMFVLCGEHTIGITLKKGFQVEEKMGNKGTYYYPKEGLVATAAVIYDLDDLSHADELDRNIITDLRQQPNQIRLETEGKETLEIEYLLQLNKESIIPPPQFNNHI